VFLLALGLSRARIVNDKPKGAYITYDDAREIYSSRESTLVALTSMRAHGWISISDVPGVFWVVKAPSVAFDFSKNIRKEIALKRGNQGVSMDDSD